jgi:hypothetical protein
MPVDMVRIEDQLITKVASTGDGKQLVLAKTRTSFQGEEIDDVEISQRELCAVRGPWAFVRECVVGKDQAVAAQAKSEHAYKSCSVDTSGEAGAVVNERGYVRRRK